MQGSMHGQGHIRNKIWKLLYLHFILKGILHNKGGKKLHAQHEKWIRMSRSKFFRPSALPRGLINMYFEAFLFTSRVVCVILYHALDLKYKVPLRGRKLAIPVEVKYKMSFKGG